MIEFDFIIFLEFTLDALQWLLMLLVGNYGAWLTIFVNVVVILFFCLTLFLTGHVNHSIFWKNLAPVRVSLPRTYLLSYYCVIGVGSFFKSIISYRKAVVSLPRVL